MTPGGALILHWVMAAVWIIGTPNTSNGYGFIIGLFIYGQLVVGGMGVFLFPLLLYGNSSRRFEVVPKADIPLKSSLGPPFSTYGGITK